MTNEVIEQAPQPVKEASTNTTKGSKVTVEAEHPPRLYFRPETGELIEVPAHESNELIADIGHWNSLVATLHDANQQVQYFEDELVELTLNPDLMTPGAHEIAERNLETAIEWQGEVLDKCRAKMEPLVKIGSSGKALLELIPIPNAPDPKKAEGKFKDMKYSKEWKNRPWALGRKKTLEGKKGVPSKTWIRPPAGSLVYVQSDKVKRHWPTFKDPQSVKWQDTMPKDANGKRKVDTKKVKEYAKQLVKDKKFQSKDGLKLNVEGTLDSWATAWNIDTSYKFSHSGTPEFLHLPVEVEAGAQLMRYLYGASLNGSFEPFKGNVSVRAEGHAEFSVAEAKASLEMYCPCKEGWMWTLPAFFYHGGADAKDVDLGAIRMKLAVEAKGTVGASIAAEVSLGIEAKVGQMPKIVGKRTKKKRGRPARTVKVVEMGPEEKMRVAGVDVGLDAFVGAKADAELKGSIEWRNPENEKKSFEAFANIGPSIAGLAGIGGTAKLTVQYVKGVFKLHVDAAICIGLGAEGKLTLEVSAKLLLQFVKWFFYQLYHANFGKLPFVDSSAFDAVKKLTFVSIFQGKSISKLFGMLEADLNEAVDSIKEKLQSSTTAREQLAQNILSDPEALRYAPPETKGMLIHQLSNDSDIDWKKTDFIADSGFFREQKDAVKHILQRWSHTQSDCNNVIQHISASGQKGDYAQNIARLEKFFKVEAPGNINLANSSHAEDFNQWYGDLLAVLKEEPTRGFPIVPSDSVQYAMQRDYDRDHPLFSSQGERSFYA